MEAKAISRFVRVSAFKARHVTRLIQGRPAGQAAAALALMPRKAARLVARTLASAMANAENAERTGGAVAVADWVVKEAFIGEAATIKRMRPKARGMAGRVRKRTSHIRIVVSDGTTN